ncbi:MAG: hypothetical protein WBA44_09975 [Mesorhizobium sp.]
MWDFSIGRTLGVVLRTWPYVLLRVVVYSAICLAYVLATGAGAGVGYGVGHIWPSSGGPPVFGLWGGILGFGFVSLALYWLREYILYMVKAAHVAVMVHYLDGRDLPMGFGQIGYGRHVVSSRFMEANLLFALDQLVKGVIAAIGRLLGGIALLIPIPGLHGLASLVHTIIGMSLTYVDEVLLGYNVRTGSNTPWQTAQNGLVLYAQNGRNIVKNAIWLSAFMWVLTAIVFLFALAPAAAILYAMPGQLAGWSFVLAIIFALAFRAAVIEPICIAALLQAYFKAIEGQTPDPAWTERLNGASRHFREMKDRAADAFRGGEPSQAG